MQINLDKPMGACWGGGAYSKVGAYLRTNGVEINKKVRTRDCYGCPFSYYC